MGDISLIDRDPKRVLEETPIERKLVADLGGGLLQPLLPNDLDRDVKGAPSEATEFKRRLLDPPLLLPEGRVQTEDDLRVYEASTLLLRRSLRPWCLGSP